MKPQFIELGPIRLPMGKKTLKYLKVQADGKNVKFMTEDSLAEDLSTQAMIDELKKRNVGVFNLSLPFHYVKNNLQETAQDNSSTEERPRKSI